MCASVGGGHLGCYYSLSPALATFHIRTAARSISIMSQTISGICHETSD